MTKTIKTLLILIFLVSLIACNNSSRKDINEVKTISIDTIHPKVISQKDTIIYDFSDFPIDSIFSTKVLTVGVFHSDEVWENAENQNWYGVFFNDKETYLAKTELKLKRVYDIVLDENENDKTGWEIQTVIKDSSYILLEELRFLKNHKIHNIKLKKNEIFPGDTLKIKHLGIDYNIFATGGKKLIQNNPELFEVWNYKLYLTATINGKFHKSLLVAHPNFDDRMIKIIFAGDIDDDGILDLIIDTSRHYNATNPTIYLSKPSEKSELVKPIGSHFSVGC